MKIISFDIEEWYISKVTHGESKEIFQKYDEMLENILIALDENGCKATFFCVGKMAEEFPEVIKKIAAKGHEIGCHSNTHTWLNKMTEKECREDTRTAIDSLEQCIGQKVKSYRAPAFSIGENNTWAFEVLAECGIERDSSVYPATRDFGGFPDFGAKGPAFVKRNGVEIKEFPIAMTSVLGKDMAYSGGGYFRFFPLWFMRQQMRKTDYSICYLHIEDLLVEQNKPMSREEYEEYFKEPGTFLARHKRHIKANLGKKGAWPKLRKLLTSKDYVNLEQANSIVDWEKVPIIDF
ncbi:MAG: polysaccharide deacetylase family protein [Prevotella sp.]|nr:polysaccharide deacetylase family protein [Prevotella sp.]